MGGPSKGGTRITTVTNAIQITQSLLADAVAKGVEDAIKTYAFITIPNLAPIIFAAYAAYQAVSKIIKVYKEYKELTKLMSPERAALIETGRVVLAETAKEVSGKLSGTKIQNATYALVSGLVSRPEMKLVTKGDERLKYMLTATLAQFVIGMATGGRDSAIEEGKRLLK